MERHVCFRIVALFYHLCALDIVSPFLHILYLKLLQFFKVECNIGTWFTMNCIHFSFPKCARGKECESIVIHIQHFVFNDCALKRFQNWTTNLAFYGYFTKCKCFKFANIHCMSTYVYLDGLSLAVCVSYRIYKKMRRNLLYLA